MIKKFLRRAALGGRVLHWYGELTGPGVWAYYTKINFEFVHAERKRNAHKTNVTFDIDPFDKCLGEWYSDIAIPCMHGYE